MDFLIFWNRKSSNFGGKLVIKINFLEKSTLSRLSYLSDDVLETTY